MDSRRAAQGTIEAIKMAKNIIAKYFRPRKFYFHTPRNTQHLIFNSIKPYSKWAHTKHQRKLKPLTFLYIFIISFTLSDIIYMTINNDITSYKLYLQIPAIMKYVDIFVQKMRKESKIIDDLMPENYYEINQFYTRLWKFMTQQQIRHKHHDQKAEKLKGQIEDFNKKYPVID